VATLATGSSGVIGKFLPRTVVPLSYKDFLTQSGPTPKVEPDSTVIHLAGIVGEGIVNKNLSLSSWVNVESLPSFLQWCLDSGASKFVYISSGHVYGAGHREPIKEGSPTSPNGSYGSQKARAEEVIAKTCDALGMRYAILRAFSILDPTMPDFSLRGAISSSLISGERIRNSNDIRDFSDTEAMAKAIYTLSNADKVKSGTIVNVCSGIGTTVGEIANRFAERCLNDSRLISGDEQLSAMPYLVGDSSRLDYFGVSPLRLTPVWLNAR